MALLKHSIYLRNINSGEYVSWTVSSQAVNTGSFRLKEFRNGSDFVLMGGEKTTGASSFRCLANGLCRYTGSDLRLELEVASSWDHSILENIAIDADIINPVTKTRLGHAYVITFEDADDNDFNDFYFDISSWISKG